mmetsp:Transcript_26860/g.57964  ORF Transcript_26860/g.57964 Transcript_26860/m.57964 type:complete len:233 (-) Transcript_26860:199-897(-)
MVVVPTLVPTLLLLLFLSLYRSTTPEGRLFVFEDNKDDNEGDASLTKLNLLVEEAATGDGVTLLLISFDWDCGWFCDSFSTATMDLVRRRVAVVVVLLIVVVLLLVCVDTDNPEEGNKQELALFPFLRLDLLAAAAAAAEEGKDLRLLFMMLLAMLLLLFLLLAKLLLRVRRRPTVRTLLFVFKLGFEPPLLVLELLLDDDNDSDKDRANDSMVLLLLLLKLLLLWLSLSSA